MKWTRRQFIRVATLSGLGLLAEACRAPGESPGPTPTPRPTPGDVTPAPTPTGRRVLNNENRPDVKPDWNVRYFQAYEPVNPETWRLEVDGLVTAPQSLSLDDLRALEHFEQDTRMKCVECWSARAVFAGFTYDALAEVVQPTSEARWVNFECADGYYESLSIDELSLPRVFFAYEMDGEPLLAEFGAPLRMVVPFKYGYKWPKAITRIEFVTVGEQGYWPTVGPYSADGTVQPGRDFPLDIGEAREIEGGEITEY